MGKQRGSFKTKVVLETLKEELTTNQIAKKYGVHPQMAAQWKKKALEGLSQKSFPSKNTSFLVINFTRKLDNLKLSLIG